MPDHYLMATVFYVTSALLDAFDGMAARRLNQSTKFGALLDQLTDRCATMCLIMTSLMLGKTSHKAFDLNENPVMRLYYTSRPVLFFMCAGNEMFYSSLYFLHFTSGPLIPVLNIHLIPLLVWVSAPVALVKAGISVLHGYISAINLSIIDLSERQATAQLSAKTD
ncbi:unnamed protein product [Oppiella nova]|uniref:CDP-diacylglycerol--inositol 3-phosphatidyltransferase n=1 Tax=Oppiella nova TaxID=334625 RepID=A0A7R9QP79_9ACAR|nr:unnamed protein product [Oppiella nova]CAG2170376.1 unnamed protein product [Oppiella nova]